ncbi:MAG TPA: CDP-alcohol phosphatidyltransferase family protein [Blastocatellia bacterium]|nr:CDP-alcohol phosphatidyltransferase family protein [Blastocatellia bacterium]
MTAIAVDNSVRKAVLNPEFKSASRQQTSLLAPLERVCLHWLARNMPSWVKSDHLTLLGLGAMFAGGVCYALANHWPATLLLVNVCLALNWFGDSLDGTLARYRDKQRPKYGFYVDHIIDAFGILFVLCGMALSGYMSWTIALATLVVYFMLSIDVYLATYTIGTFKISFYKFSPTELRILLAIGNIRAMTHPTANAFGDRYLFFDIGAVVAMALMAVVLIVSVIRNTVTLYRAERI